MNKPEDAIRFLDDLDIKLASESRSEWNRQFTGINIVVEHEIVFRTSYRDILLIQTIVNKAMTFLTGYNNLDSKAAKQDAFDNAANAFASRGITDGPRSFQSATRQSGTRSKSNLRAEVIMTTEEVGEVADE